jgi:hypothetical protein
MTKQSPRIYTYKITFEEVPYYYYGSKKEKWYNQEYWGSPITHKWCWDFYTPKKQILEFFEFSDEGYKECRRVEERLIKPVLNDTWCLNQNCGGSFSLEITRKSGTISYKKQKELGIGIFAVPSEKRREYGLKLVENGIGIHSQTKEQLSENGKKGAAKNKENKVGIFSLTKEQLSENGRKSNSQKWMCLKTGYITTSAGLTHYQRARGIDTSKRKRID